MHRIYRLQLCHHILAITLLIPSYHEASKVSTFYLLLLNPSLFSLDLFHLYANTCFLATLPSFSHIQMHTSSIPCVQYLRLNQVRLNILLKICCTSLFELIKKPLRLLMIALAFAPNRSLVTPSGKFAVILLLHTLQRPLCNLYSVTIGLISGNSTF